MAAPASPFALHATGGQKKRRRRKQPPGSIASDSVKFEKEETDGYAEEDEDEDNDELSADEKLQLKEVAGFEFQPKKDLPRASSVTTGTYNCI